MNAEICTIEDVFSRCNIVIATTGTVSKSVCHAMRMPFYPPKELRERIKDADGRISILFGRENWGLNNEEVKRSDMICTIPTAEEYPDPQPLACGRRRLLRACEPPAPHLYPRLAGGYGIPVPAHRPVPRCGPPPGVQAGEHDDPHPPCPRQGEPHYPRGKHPARPAAQERVAYRPLAARPGSDREGRTWKTKGRSDRGTREPRIIPVHPGVSGTRQVLQTYIVFTQPGTPATTVSGTGSKNTSISLIP